MRKIVCTLGLAFLAAATAWSDSLWQERGNSLFTDNKAYSVGDVVTVVVVEESKVSASAGSSQQKTSDTSAEVAAVDYPGHKVFVKDGATTPKVKYGASRKFDGQGSYQLTGTMETSLTAVVLEVLPNGNLVIEGSRERKSVDEKVIVRISGIVRPADIRADNTVLSTSVAEGRIVFDSTGPIARSNRRGWFDRIVDVVWPF